MTNLKNTAELLLEIDQLPVEMKTIVRDMLSIELKLEKQTRTTLAKPITKEVTEIISIIPTAPKVVIRKKKTKRKSAAIEQRVIDYLKSVGEANVEEVNREALPDLARVSVSAILLRLSKKTPYVKQIKEGKKVRYFHDDGKKSAFTGLFK